MCRMELKERNLKYKGHRVKVFEDVIKGPEGEMLYYDFVENRNGSGVLLIDEDGKLVFVKQFRNALNGFDIEIPAGCAELKDISIEKSTSDVLTRSDEDYDRDLFLKEDNPFYQCAVREAEEETGLIPRKLCFVSFIIAAVGLFSERTAIYIGTDTVKGTIHRDSDEYIDIVRLTLDEAKMYINDGRIIDSKTIIAILAYESMLLEK